MLQFFSHAERKNFRPEVAIRMEAIGGQGANSAGKILSDAAVSGLGYSGCHFASFGSEKRGSPVQSFVRFSPTLAPMRSAFFSTAPDLIVVFHEAMLELHPTVLAGASENSVLVVNSTKKPSELRFPVGTRLGKVCCVDAGAVSRRRRCGINAVILGALLPVTPEIPPAALEASLEKFFARLSGRARSRNLAGLRDGSHTLTQAPFRAEQADRAPACESLPRLGWANAPGGGIIVNPGNTVLRDQSLSRQGMAPRFKPEECIHCGYCDMLCPDFCFVWGRSAEDGSPALKGIDYQFCKGCQKCVSVCPSGALSLSAESDIPPAERLHKFPGIDAAELERKWHHVDWNVSYPDDEDEQ